MRTLLAAALLAGAALVSPVQAQVGRPLPSEASALEDFTGIDARSSTELMGRTLLIEFFAYW